MVFVTTSTPDFSLYSSNRPHHLSVLLGVPLKALMMSASVDNAMTNNNSAPDAANAKQIPQLQSVATSIFVPITEDLLQPYHPPSDRIEHLRAILANLDAHAASVRGNLHDLFNHERARIIHDEQAAVEGARQRGDPPAPAAPGMSPAETDLFIANMEAEPNGAVPASMTEFPEAMVLDGHQQRELTPREVAAREMALVLRRFCMDVKGFNVHYMRTRAFYQQELEKERVLRTP